MRIREFVSEFFQGLPLLVALAVICYPLALVFSPILRLLQNFGG